MCHACAQDGSIAARCLGKRSYDSHQTDNRRERPNCCNRNLTPWRTAAADQGIELGGGAAAQCGDHHNQVQWDAAGCRTDSRSRPGENHRCVRCGITLQHRSERRVPQCAALWCQTFSTRRQLNASAGACHVIPNSSRQWQQARLENPAAVVVQPSRTARSITRDTVFKGAPGALSFAVAAPPRAAFPL